MTLEDFVERVVSIVEDLIVAKLEWARRGASERQRRDVREILAQSGRELDRAYLERWVRELGLQREWARVRDEDDRRD